MLHSKTSLTSKFDIVIMFITYVTLMGPMGALRIWTKNRYVVDFSLELIVLLLANKMLHSYVISILQDFADTAERRVVVQLLYTLP